jgi:general secretion pathway protein K
MQTIMSTTAKLRRSALSSEGFIVIAVLWMLAALAALVSFYAIYVTNSALAVSASNDTIKADPLIAAGVELAAYQLLGVKANERPTSGQFIAHVGKAMLTVAFQTEAARIDLNAAPKELLVGLLVGLGAGAFDAGDFADRIIAWRTPASTKNLDTDPENSFYRSSGLSYTPRHAPFVHVGELWLVYSIPSALIERMLPFVTVFNGRAQIDVVDAAPQVIAAMPGMTSETLQAILEARNAGELNKQSLATLLGVSGQQFATVEGGKAMRVGVRIDFDNGRHSAAEAVILLPDEGLVPYRVLSWRIAFDGTTDQPLDFGRR